MDLSILHGRVRRADRHRRLRTGERNAMRRMRIDEDQWRALKIAADAVRRKGGRQSRRAHATTRAQ